MLSPGSVVERYEVERELGGGGMARVYKVHHVALGSVHALKVLDPELVGNAELRSRFLDEGRIQARLKHPNILGITDVVAAPGVAGLVMDYLEGESLDKYLADAKQPPAADEVREIFLQVLEGLGYAHAQGVIHRDIKPSNIFLSRNHGRRVVRLLDFGIAKVEGNEGRPTTRTGVRMGTPQYMSPEQIRGARDVTVRSDIFSLGVTLYELATAQPCFQSESDFNIMEKIVRSDFVPAEVVHPALERRLASAIRRAMELDPARRFGSCQEFAAALVMAEEAAPVEPPAPVPAPAPTPAPEPPKPSGLWLSPSAPIPGRKQTRSVPVAPVSVAPTTVDPSPAPVVIPPRAAVAAPEPEPEPEPEPRKPTPAPVPVPRKPTPAPVPEPRRAAPAPAPTPAPVAEPRKPAAVLEQSRPAVAQRPLPVKKPEPVALEDGPRPRRAWRWALFFVLAGLMALFGSGLLGLLTGKG